MTSLRLLGRTVSRDQIYIRSRENEREVVGGGCIDSNFLTGARSW